MRKAKVFAHGIPAGTLEELSSKGPWNFLYDSEYEGEAVSLNMPTDVSAFEFSEFPPFFEGLLPEGMQLEALLRIRKFDRNDLFSQLIAVGEDMVGAVTVKEIK
jgi:serine/threonine-protein kinase HipA